MSRPRALSPKFRMIQMKAAPRRQDLGNTCNERQRRPRYAQLSESSNSTSLPQRRLWKSTGRPRKNRALVSTKVDGRPGIGFEDRFKSLAIKEAYRIILIREGDRTERIPVIQAILRKVAVAAAHGNIRAQQNYLNLVIGAEADRRIATTELFTFAVEYKEHWGRVLAERARKGTTG